MSRTGNAGWTERWAKVPQSALNRIPQKLLVALGNRLNMESVAPKPGTTTLTKSASRRPLIFFPQLPNSLGPSQIRCDLYKFGVSFSNSEWVLRIRCEFREPEVSFANLVCHFLSQRCFTHPLHCILLSKNRINFFGSLSTFSISEQIETCRIKALFLLIWRYLTFQ